MKLKICHLYYDLLDLYGDRGNILTLTARCRWRGIEAEVQTVSLGGQLDFKEIDILFLGGGSDREQGLLVEDLKRHADELRPAIHDGLAVLTICGGYQMLGQYYQTGEGKKLPGLGILDLWTIAGKKRMIGNVAVKLDPETMSGSKATAQKLSTLVGFENHSGKTYLGEGLKPFGTVIHGHGNNGEDGCEGLRYLNVFGTYLHGPLLPKNPHFADMLLEAALNRRGCHDPLPQLDDRLEELAHQAMLNRLLS